MRARHGLMVALLLLLPLPAPAQNGILERREKRTVTVPGYPVGSYREGPQRVLTMLDGQETLLLERLDDPTQTLEAPVEALKLVNIKAVRTKRGSCCGRFALTTGRRQPRNRLFYRNPRIACAAYTAYILRHCGRPGGSYSATAQYGQLRRWGGTLVASRMSTRYVPYLRYLQAGDFIFFHKSGGQIGHCEIYVGNGMVSGTSSSAGRVGIRRLGNRGFRLATVVRI